MSAAGFGRGAPVDGRSGRRDSLVLRVDPIRCDGRGICAEILPEMVVMDDWGFPIIDGKPISSDLLAMARRAAAACPTLALRLEREGG